MWLHLRKDTDWVITLVNLLHSIWKHLLMTFDVLSDLINNLQTVFFYYFRIIIALDIAHFSIF